MIRFIMSTSEKILALSRSCTCASAFCLSHIARYAPSVARLNPRHICDPDVNIFEEQSLNFRAPGVVIKV